MSGAVHTWPRIEAALIDLDGTLLDSIPDLAYAANAMRTELGMPTLPESQIATFVGKGVENLVRRTMAASLAPADLSEEVLQQALAVFFRHYHLVNGEKSTLYAGVVEGLDALRAQGLKLAVVTNKPHEFTVPLLARAGLDHYFDIVVSGDTCERKKPDPLPMLHACNQLGVAPAAALAIGDSINDAQAGRAAGLRVLAVPYGYNEGHDVHTLDVDGIVASILDASHWVTRQNQQDSSAS